MFGAWIDNGETTLTASLDEVEALVESVAAEANHEDNRHRQKRLDAAFSMLSNVLEDLEAMQERQQPRLVATVASDLARDPRQRDRVVLPAPELLTKWGIVDSDLWDRDALDLVEPAYIEFRPDGTGSFRFIVVLKAGSTVVRRPSVAVLVWSSAGRDPTNATACGWAVLDGDELQLHIYFHMGDDSGFLRAAHSEAAPRLHLHRLDGSTWVRNLSFTAAQDPHASGFRITILVIMETTALPVSTE